MRAAMRSRLRARVRPRRAIELWAGVECTVNRVGDRYLDQLELSGHAERASDLDRIAQLGIRTIRFPVLWERCARGDGTYDFAWCDARLARLRELGIEPIVGLVHHGSGPRDTSLLDARFPARLAAYARVVAARYPWVRAFTPINEPLTTARFSALYGYWYPHHRDAASMVRALLVEIEATRQAMAAIRGVTPGARLVQTEDLGRATSTRHLAHQAQYENTRRFLSFDLLCGMVTPDHPLHDHLLEHGAGADELADLAARPCPPDVIGINYYVTSDRFLDEHLDAYPAWTHSGNGRERYADVEAVRVAGRGIAGHRRILGDAWRRYRRPLALTEVHIGARSEDRLRWLLEAWQGAHAAAADGADVRAVTAWALFGSRGWDTLVVRDGTYECGAFDVRGTEPRATAVAGAIRALARREPVRHPLAGTDGWWRRDVRVLYGGTATPGPPPAATRPLLIAGATGTVGRAFSVVCTLRGLPHRLMARAEMDIADPASVARALERHEPWAVINAAGYARVDDAEVDPVRCWRENVAGAEVLARACAAARVSLLTFSTDLVFDGAQHEPYVESAAARPLGVLGRSKLEAEQRVLHALPEALVVRTGALFGPWDEHNFVTVALRTLATRRPFAAAADVVVSPTYLPDLVDASLDLLVDAASGIWHLANDGSLSWSALARRAGAAARIETSSLIECGIAALGLRAVRPRFSVLQSERGRLLPSFESGLARYALECARAARSGAGS